MQTTWRPILLEETRKPYFKDLLRFVAEQRQQVTVFPPDAEVFAALHLTPIEQVKVLILGQDPYKGYLRDVPLYSVSPSI